MPKLKIAYITLLDQYHPGIYDSQVIDVIQFMNDKLDTNVRLYAFLSIKELLNTSAKQKIKAQLSDARVLPAFPKLRWFYMTRFLLALILLWDGRKSVIARNVFACNIALWCRKIGFVKKVALDSRSAISAEIKEFDVFPIPYLRDNIQDLEKKSVLKSDFRLAVSHAMNVYWRKHFNYEKNEHVIIPCTLKQGLELTQPSQGKSDNISIVYAGSNAPWQGLNLIFDFLRKHPNVCCTLLTRENNTTAKMKAVLGDRLTVKWLKSGEVVKELNRHDYGLLLRPFCDTNRVASPGKFAEYLSAGLNIICSKEIGDYPEFIKKHKCGLIWDNEAKLELKKTVLYQKEQNIKLAQNHFLKSSIANKEAYEKLLNTIHA